MRTLLLLASVVLLAFLLAGCGSGGDGVETPGDGSTTVSLGTMEIDVAAAAGFQMTPLRTATDSEVMLTALWGSRITRLVEVKVNQIAFRGEGSIYTMNGDGSVQTDLTVGPGFGLCGHPAWSPDGRKIAYDDVLTGTGDIYVMNANGTGVLQLTSSVESEGQPAWSPDGMRICYHRFSGGDYDIWTMNADGTGQTSMGNGPEANGNPSWSPDGRKIAYDSDADGNYEICVMSENGDRMVQITDNAANDQNPAWSPDGRKIVFESDRGGNYDIYAMNADGTSQTRLTTHAAPDLDPIYTPDGRHILFTTERDDSDDPSVYRMDADGSDEGGVMPFTELGAREPSPNPAPSIYRALIGGAGTDGGSNPPFGGQRYCAVLGMTDADGMVSAATVALAEGATGLTAAAVDYGGGSMTALKITATGILRMIEDMGRDRPTRIWEVSGTPAPGAIVVFFSGATGRIRSIIAVTDTAAAHADAMATASSSGRTTLTGSFTGAWDASDPEHNHVSGKAARIVLDEGTGAVLAAQ